MTAQHKMLDIVTESGEAMATASYDEAHKYGLRHRSAHVLVANSKKEIFLQKRAKTMLTLPGFYENSAAGQVDSGDSVEQTALQELEEELGIKAKPQDLIDLGDFHYVNKYRADWMDNEIARLYLLHYDGGITIDKDEIEEGSFRSIADIKRMIAKGERFSPVFLEMFKRYQKLEG